MITSIAKVGYAPVIVGENGSVTYGDVIRLEDELAGGREFTAEASGELTEVYANGKLVKAVEINNGYTIKLILLDLIDDIQKDWMGNQVNASTGTVAEYASNRERPKFCLILAEDTDDGVGKITYYYNCQVNQRPSKTTKTSEGKFEAQFREFAIAARPRSTDKLVCFETIGTAIPDTVALPGAEAGE